MLEKKFLRKKQWKQQIKGKKDTEGIQNMSRVNMEQVNDIIYIYIYIYIYGTR